MDSKYLEAQHILESTLIRLNSILDKAPYKSFEDRKACKVLEWTIENIEDRISSLKYFSKDLIYGNLYKLSNGKYAIDDSNYFSCGYPIEIWSESDQEWQVGRVEFTDNDYYFYNYDGDNFGLYEGLRVRIRK